jgi:hypothetical protein
MMQEQRKGYGYGGFLVMALAGAAIPLLGGLIAVSIYGVEFIKTGRVSDLDHPERFDPIAALPTVGRMVPPGARMVRLSAQSVRPDGTVALDAQWRPVVLFQFAVSHSEPGLPVGAPGAATTSRWITVRADRPGRYVVRRQGSKNYYGWSRGLTLLDPVDMPASISTPADLPTCHFKTLWDEAIKLGAPKDAVANILYSARGYAFTIEGTPHSYTFDHACKLATK